MHEWSRSPSVEQLEVPQDEHGKVHRRGASREVDEDVPVLVPVVADGELIREVAHGNVRSLAEDQPRILVVPEVVAQSLFEVAPLLASEPSQVTGRSASTPSRTVKRSMPRSIVIRRRFRLSARRWPCRAACDEREDARPSRRPELDGCYKSLRQEPLDEVVDFLPTSDPGERGLQPADEHAGVDHDSSQEASLTLCETERHEDLSALGCRPVRPQRIRR